MDCFHRGEGAGKGLRPKGLNYSGTLKEGMTEWAVRGSGCSIDRGADECCHDSRSTSPGQALHYGRSRSSIRDAKFANDSRRGPPSGLPEEGEERERARSSLGFRAR